MSGNFVTRGLALLGLCGGLSVLGGCGGVEPTPAQPESLGEVQGEALVTSITQGTYVIRSMVTQKCLDVASSSTADGAKVQQWTCNGTNAQRFRITPTSGGYFSIINVNSNKGLDIEGASTAQNARIHQWTYGGGNHQQFRFVNRGGTQFSMHLRHTDMAVDLYWGRPDDGTETVQYPYSGATNQLWSFDRVDGGGNGGTGLAEILSESTFNAMFPNRNPFYTYSALIAAARTMPAFANTGTLETRKREVAAFFANTAHETGNFVYIEEIAQGEYCGSWGPPGCNCVAGKRYFGRGPIQLSWNGNYCAAGTALGLPLHTDPDLLARDANASWRSAFWFWTTQAGAGSIPAHRAMVEGRGFGETIRAINGAIECNGGNPGQVQSRINNYNRFTNMLGVSPGGNLGC
ncbi:Endo-1,4-beta-xylanase A precursor [Myxococcus hansupus]|uniref:Endo-1,4-beta-xylanase A n=1 Tax=Pseudomyxococcus hansupus TaxID=1297742 RepID=A0A0H4XBX3_9BACT|nr:RICIN domain-containing protein [Myxococcus hansupus]AKQ65452.1 Endo-1,4-beta-xylanase A precursor [Myxococcus hansupus]